MNKDATCKHCQFEPGSHSQSCPEYKEKKAPTIKKSLKVEQPTANANQIGKSLAVDIPEWIERFNNKFNNPETMWARDENGQWYGKQDVKEFIRVERQRAVEEAIATERLRCYDIIHNHFMKSHDKKVLNLLELIQKEILQ